MSAASEPAIKAAIADPDPLVRMAVPQALPPSASRAMIDAILPLLTDPVRAEAAAQHIEPHMRRPVEPAPQ
jgi:hypothetical protein